jgi:hypothetical protein
MARAKDAGMELKLHRRASKMTQEHGHVNMAPAGVASGKGFWQQPD